MSRPFACPLCGWKGHPSFELTAKGKLAAKCGSATCDYIDAGLSPSDFNEGVAVTKEGAPVRVDTKPTAAPIASAAAAVARTYVAPPSSAPPAAPADVIGMIRARRDYLEMEIARLEGMKVEHRQLSKMLAAAERVSHAEQSAAEN
jgi:hypothetical protein